MIQEMTYKPLTNIRQFPSIYLASPSDDCKFSITVIKYINGIIKEKKTHTLEQKHVIDMSDYMLNRTITLEILFDNFEGPADLKHVKFDTVRNDIIIANYDKFVPWDWYVIYNIGKFGPICSLGKTISTSNGPKKGILFNPTDEK